MSSSSSRKMRDRKPKEAIKDSDPHKIETCERGVEEKHGSSSNTKNKASSKRKGKAVKSNPSSSNKKPKKEKAEVNDSDSEGWSDDEVIGDVDLQIAENDEKLTELSKFNKRKGKRVVVGSDSDCRLDGKPIPDAEARNRWPERYIKKTVKAESSSSSKNSKKKTDGEDEILYALCHYRQAVIDGVTYYLGDDTYVKGTKGDKDYIGRIVEFFKTTDGRAFFTSQWFFKAEDTVIKNHASLVDNKRVFFSELKNDNPLDCITSKIKIVKVSPSVDLVAKKATIPSCDFYYDMQYSPSYTTFSNLLPEIPGLSSGTSSSLLKNSCADDGISKVNMTLLDLYSGCGGMSTGLSLGASTLGVKLVTRWAVDYNKYACESLERNHDETEVRNESAESFLSLLKEWRELCLKFSLFDTQPVVSNNSSLIVNNKGAEVIHDPDDVEDIHDPETPSSDFEVEKLVAICYGDPNKTEKSGLHFKVRWKGYDCEDDTWEPISGLESCEERVKDFVTRGYNSNIIPLPGNVDVICGGPPCQGISGFNRFRDKENPLKDPKNYQLVVFMDIVEYLKPRFVLMENVVDIVKFSSGFLIRYAMGRLVSIDYQARLGMMVAGCYGLPQFRMRVFLWAARPTEKLPPYPLPTHEVVVRGVIPTEFEVNVVAYDEGRKLELAKALVLRDAIFDLPEITNDEIDDEVPYMGSAKTEFLRYIRSSKNELMGIRAAQEPPQEAILYDHVPYKLNKDDYKRTCLIPKRKKANFRDLPGVRVNSENKVELDPAVKRIYLPSKAPLVPDYALSWKKGTATEPFGRVWWDETVPTVVTRAQPHNRVILHPEQDRVLSVRENARLQGFPDYYKFCGPIKERYMQVGNAVAVPVARALGHVLGLALQGACDDQPLFTLPPGF